MDCYPAILGWSGGGRVCGGIDPGRLRVFCCAPPSGEPLFLPVPLKDLFPSPPTGDDVKTKFDLNIDNTWGDGEADNNSEDEPNEAAFQFHVLASPGEIQTSLDKRDGSHWEVFNCTEAVSEGEHTVQMVCTDSSERSNYGDIYKGHGVEGTILEMPQNRDCGLGKHAVAKSLEPAGNQFLPQHLVERKLLHDATIYDLKFDYNFTRVPWGFGPTQLRVDFSNQEGYWNKIVAAPSSKKSKRTLDEVGGNHRRWLEEECRDDYHRGSVSREELYRRWFGDDALQWLKELLHIDVTVEKRHDYEEVSAIILKEDWTCGPFRAKIDAVATAAIEMSTSFGITIITELGANLNLSKSYVHFNNEGSIEAILTIDALMKLEWNSGVFTIVPLPIPGVGPRFGLNARFKARVSIEDRIEAKAELANWEIRQTYPQQDDYKPKEIESANRQFPTDGIASPSFEVSVTAQGYAEAHIIPTLAFGIKFDKQWDLEDAEIELYGDLYGRVRAMSDLVGGDCLFGYKVEAGLNKRIIPEGDKEWECVTAETKRHIEGRGESRNSSHSLIGKPSLRKRLVPYEPLVKLPDAEKLCPVEGNQGAQDCADTQNVFEFYDDSTSDAHPVEFRKRSIFDDDGGSLFAKGPFNETDDYNDYSDDQEYGTSASEMHLVERGPLAKRAPGKKLAICNGAHQFHIKKWDTSGTFDIYDNADWADCSNYDFVIQATRQRVPYTTRAGNPALEEYPVEHVLEAQMVVLFFETTAFSDLCFDMEETGSGWFDTNAVDPIVPRAPRRSPWQYIADAWPYSRGTETRSRIPYPAHKEDDFVFVIGPVSNIKSKAFQNFPALSGTDDMGRAVASEATVGDAIRTMKTALMLWKYLTTGAIRDTLVAQATRVGDRMEEI
ncbi:glycosyl hydrolase family 18 protein [Colletotrichum graminicola]|nr:glycosyl hydrolase family 18 protein [Colletotrichum graminicola]